MPDRFEKFFENKSRGPGALESQAARREADNELARAKSQKLDGMKEYEKAAASQATKAAKLRELRLAKEAQEFVAESKRKPSARWTARGKR